jgi:hemoglobin
MALFEKYGGRGFWADSVDVFYTRLLQDPQLGRFFTGKDVNKVKAMNTHLLECALGNTSEHFSVSVKRVHAGMTVNRAAFNRFVELFLAVMREKGVTAADLEEIAEVLAAFEDDVRIAE